MKSLKWLIAVMWMGLFISSCLDDEPTVKVSYQYTPVDSIQLGEIRPARQVTEIKTFFTRDSECETFFDYDYLISGNERTVSLVVSQLENQQCMEISQVSSNSLQFKPEESGVYVFRFWAGNDENDEPIFIIKEIEIP